MRRDQSGRFARQPRVRALLPEPPLPPPADPVNHPTDSHPRWRLRVFDRCWPWRATRREALRDAMLSHNARRDQDDQVIYLDACANIQRDPPMYMDLWRSRMRNRS